MQTQQQQQQHTHQKFINQHFTTHFTHFAKTGNVLEEEGEEAPPSEAAMTKSSPKEIEELRKKKLELQKELRLIDERLLAGSSHGQPTDTSCDDDDDYNDGNDSDEHNAVKNGSVVTYSPDRVKRNGNNKVAAVTSKSGYLFKWQDRSIGWGGTKWALRFVKLSNGRLSYYLSHLESSSSPRYVLSLRGCAVADEGWKRNKRHKTTSKAVPKGEDPPIDEVGAYFFVFSIYHRQDSFVVDPKSPNRKSSSAAAAAADKLSNSEYVPLLRFSTPSLAEKNQWIKLLSEACAYCETDAFLEEEATRNAEEEFRRQQQQQLASAMPQAERGTLPPLYFAPSNDNNKRGMLSRRPSFSKLPRSSMYRTVVKSRDAEKSEKQGFPASKPMHRSAAPSVLSGESQQTQNYRGFFNLGIIILIVSNFRLILNAVRKHGFVLAQIDFDGLSDFSLDHWEQFPFLTGLLLLQGFLIGAFVIEWSLSRRQLYEPVGMILHQINAHSSFAVTIFMVWNFIDNPAVGGTLLLTGAITWMKLISYALANEDYRYNARNKKKEESIQANLAQIENLDEKDWEVEYPSNVTLSNMYYFWCAPTLTYQIAFPKTPRIRPLRVLGLLIRMIVTFSVFTFLIYQIVAPNLESLLSDLEATGGRYTTSILAEYWLKLTITNTYMWLLMFYFYFHLYMNFFAELLRFGDRVFYKEWWNSTEVSAYWRLWNLPVHYWLVRHLYFPCVRHNVPKMAATFIVFFFSAVMHEVIISVPFHMLRPWSFLGMMGQLPLVMITKWLYRKFPGSSVGNVLFWVSFCVVGQPMAILLYSIDYKYAQLHNDDTAFIDSPEVCTFKFLEKCLVR